MHEGRVVRDRMKLVVDMARFSFDVVAVLPVLSSERDEGCRARSGLTGGHDSILL